MRSHFHETTKSGISLRTGRINRRSLLKLGLGFAGAVSVGTVFAACASREDDDSPAAAPDDDASDDSVAESDDSPEDDDQRDEVAAESDDDFDIDQLIDEWLEEFDPVEIPELDPGASEVEIQGVTYDVWAYQNTWVGEVTDDLFIAFSIEEGYSAGTGEISAYACDSGDASVYLTGDLVDGEADLDDCIDKITLSLEDGEITGEITLEGEEPISFIAVPSEGPAGLYRAETMELGEFDHTPRWVVLEDGRQRGGIKCRNPWTGDCFQCPAPR